LKGEEVAMAGRHGDWLLEAMRMLIAEGEEMLRTLTHPHSRKTLEMNQAALRANLATYETLFAEFRAKFEGREP
jgi:hypothetical protein